MDYQNTLKYLYESMPMFQQIGGKAYKPGLETTHKLDEHFGYPHQQFKTIHIAGTNGKGSCSHTIVAVLQSAGVRVGLFTSPFGRLPRTYPHQRRNDTRRICSKLCRRSPFLLRATTSFIFRVDHRNGIPLFCRSESRRSRYRSRNGRTFDCTNIIHPDLCVITNIGFDHMQYLGNTLTK